MLAYLVKSMKKSSYPKKRKKIDKIKYQIIPSTKTNAKWDKKI